MEALLNGIRALDWGSFANGPLIGAMLGDLGAEVIKIEDPTKGDPARGMQTMYGSSMNLAHGRNILIECTNRNKRSITIDLKKEGGKRVAYKLVEGSDIFFTNYSKRIAKNLGMDYETLCKHNPRLIYCIASGFGTKGADAEKRAFDSLALAQSGLMLAAGEQGSPPAQIVGAVADTLGATISTLGILGALAYRERTNTGQEVETSLLDALIWLQYTGVSTYLLRGRETRRYSRLDAANPLANHYECKDGKWIMLAEPQSDRFWHEFCQVLQLAELENQPKFNTATHRKENKRELISILDRIFSTRTRDRWIREFRKAKVRFAYAPVNTVSEMVEDPQVGANEYIVDYNHPMLGATKQVAFPARFSKTPATIRYPAPEIGQHTEEILLEFGYTWEEISELKSKEVI
jgi:crotonobetainyl-CoA:carnitine CoA-transferase CaiB-like acyl-CoA transferase